MNPEHIIRAVEAFERIATALERLADMKPDPVGRFTEGQLIGVPAAAGPNHQPMAYRIWHAAVSRQVKQPLVGCAANRSSVFSLSEAVPLESVAVRHRCGAHGCRTKWPN